MGDKPLRVYVGWDPRDALAYEVCVRSLEEHASIPVQVIALKDWELRRKRVYWRPYRVDERGQMWDEPSGQPLSTQFSLTRFCVPALEDYEGGWVLFTDADMLWRADVAALIALFQDDKALMCVKHDHRPNEASKMDGVRQTVYQRKNWSSLMAFNLWRNKALTKYCVNNMSKEWLHRLLWLKDEEIGGLPEAWNWLEGYSDPAVKPNLVHFTRGTPDFPGYEDAAYADEWRSVAEKTMHEAAVAA
ncbi:MAG: hypothetical protein ACE5JZ_06555 [Kiloniellales bacterium]